MSQYPRWVHHPIHKDKLVKSAEEHKALGEGWGDDSAVWRAPKIEEAAPVQEGQSEEAPAEIPQEAAPAEKPNKKGKKGKQSA